MNIFENSDRMNLGNMKHISQKNNIYLDYAASTPTDPNVVSAMNPYWSEHYGNPSSAHRQGQKAQIAVDNAKLQIADKLGCDPGEIIFTSGATESNNLAIQGVIKKYISNNAGAKTLPHIITTAIEHDSVHATCEYLEKTAGADVTYIRPDKDGTIKASSIKKHIRDETVLVSITHVQSEFGLVQPIKEIGKMLIRENKTRENKITFHADSAQALNCFNCHVNHTKVDLMSLSGNKIYGPKGIGILYVREGTEISPLVYGGAQQKALRPGTMPTPLIVGIGKAVELISIENKTEISNLKKTLITNLKNTIPDIKINGPDDPYGDNVSPSHASIYFPRVDGITLMTALDMRGVSVSYGPACSSGAQKKSNALKALGYDDERITNSIRISLGKYTTKEEIHEASRNIFEEYEKLKSSYEKT